MLAAPTAAITRGCTVALMLACAAGCSYEPPTAPPDPGTAYDTLHVVIDDGQFGTYPGLDVFLVGRAGYGRHVYLDTLLGATIALDGHGLAAPRLVQTGTGTFGVLNVVFTSAGRVNVTPLTELVAAGVLGFDPGYGVGLVTDTLARPYLDVVTDQRIALSQTEATDLLERGGITVLPAGVDWATYPFATTAGDPMHETIASIMNLGFDYEGSRQMMIRNGALCSVSMVIATQGATSRRFCPATRFTSTDPEDPTITIYEMTNAFGDSLVVRSRGTAVTGVTYWRGDPERYTCDAATCQGISFAPPASDGSVAISFASTTLTQVDGTKQTVLAGSTTSQAPGGPTDVLVCTLGKGAMVVRISDGSINQGCTFPQDGGPVFRGRSTYRWQAETGFEVRAYFIGESVYAINVTNVPDPTDGSPVTFQCVGSACTGVAIAPDTLERRKLTFTGTSLTGVRSDGSPSEATISLTGELRDYAAVAPESIVSDANCTALPGADSVRFLATGQPLWHICIAPFDSLLNPMPYKYAYDPGDGSRIFILGGGGLPGTSSGFITLFTRDGVVESAYSGILFDNWQCLGPQCSGISISAPDERNQVTVTLDNVLMQEVFGLGRASPPTILDRETVLSGSIRGVQVLQ